jgi:hypothetical protein
MQERAFELDSCDRCYETESRVCSAKELHYHADGDSGKWVCAITVAIPVDVSFDGDGDLKARKHHLLQCFPHHREALLILRKDTDASEDEITKFQHHNDSWFSRWIQEYGREGCTNYTPMLSSSHVMKYMQE